MPISIHRSPAPGFERDQADADPGGERPTAEIVMLREQLTLTRAENAALRQRLTRTGAALEAAITENGHLRRDLARRPPQSRPPTAQSPIPPVGADRMTHVRSMLRDRGSRNP